MLEFLVQFAQTGWATLLDVAPIVAVLVVFQVAVLRRRLPNVRRIAAGFVYVLLGLTLHSADGRTHPVCRVWDIWWKASSWERGRLARTR